MAASIEAVTGRHPFEPRSDAYLRDPYAHLARMRADGPCWIDPGSGKWFLLSYDHVQAGLAQIVRGQHAGQDRHVHFPANPFAADGPGHTEPRRLIVPALTNRAVQRYRDRAQEIVDDALSAALGDRATGGELRVVDELGFRLPYALTCDLLGVPDVDNRDELKAWTWQSLELIDAFSPYLSRRPWARLLADRSTWRAGLKSPVTLDGLGGAATRRVRVWLTSDRNMHRRG